MKIIPIIDLEQAYGSDLDGMLVTALQEQILLREQENNKLKIILEQKLVNHTVLINDDRK